jgi:hypothetical protein
MAEGFPGKRFDVFLSHSSVDNDSARQLKESLASRGMTAWLDLDEIRAGEVFVGALEAGLQNSDSVVILVSPESMSSGWVNEEYSRALAISEKRGAPMPVIPALLRNAELPGFLANRSWVDFRDPDRFEEGVDALVRGIRREPGDTIPGRGAPIAVASQGPRNRRWYTTISKKPSSMQFIMTVLVLGAATALLMYSQSRQQFVGAYVLFALAAALITFGLMKATGMVKTRKWKFGGAAAGFIVILGMLLPFVGDATVDIRGTVSLDGFPPKNLTVYLPSISPGAF